MIKSLVVIYTLGKKKTVIIHQDKIQNAKVDTKSDAHTEVLVTRAF